MVCHNHRPEGGAARRRPASRAPLLQFPMPKMKTHSGAKKRFKLTATGKVRGRHAFTSHILEKKSPKRKRALGAPRVLSADDSPADQADAGRAPQRAAKAQGAASFREAKREAGSVIRVKRSVHARKKRRATLELTKGFRGRGALQLPPRQGGVDQGGHLRLPRSAQPQARLQAAMDHPHQRRRSPERDELLPVHARPLAGRGRARPQGAGGHRRARRRCVPTFCRGRPRGVGRLISRPPTYPASRAPRCPIRGHESVSLIGKDGAFFVAACHPASPTHHRASVPSQAVRKIPATFE